MSIRHRRKEAVRFKHVKNTAIVSTPTALEDLAGRLHGAPRVAVDTEAASFHRYVDRVYLVQVSTDSETVLIDPLAVHDLAPLGQVLGDPNVEIVFHDADYDLRVLDRDYGFRATRVFDTRVAAQLAGEAAIGLGALLERHFRIRLDKKYQRADWSLRPLTEGMIAYAAADTAHLPALRDLLEERLRALNRLHWAEEEFLRLEGLRWTQPKDPEPDAFLRMKGARKVPRRHLGVLRALYEWRESVARASDRPPFRIVGNEIILALAIACPRNREEMRTVRGIPAKIAARYGDELWSAIADGLRIPDSELPTFPRTKRPPPDAGYERRLERLKAARDAAAGSIPLDPGLVCPNGTLQAVARAEPRRAEDLDAVEGLRRWQREVIGDAVLLEAAGTA